MSEYEAGRETDALVAERLGWRRKVQNGVVMVSPPTGTFAGAWLAPTRYSTEIEAAWTLAEWAHRTPGRSAFPYGFGVDDDGGMGWNANVGGFTATADTAPLAITRAFLKATEPTP